MAGMVLTIQHNGTLFEPPVKEGVEIEWERTGSPGKLTFTVLKTEGVDFSEGDRNHYLCGDLDSLCRCIDAWGGSVLSVSLPKNHHL